MPLADSSQANSQAQNNNANNNVDNQANQGYERDESENFEELPLSVLLKFIKPFSGDRNELNTFITNVNSAFLLAMQRQKPSLFLFVVSQLSTNVINEIDINEIASWTELKNKLKLYYCQTKHIAQTHEELETLKQLPSGSVRNGKQP